MKDNIFLDNVDVFKLITNSINGSHFKQMFGSYAWFSPNNDFIGYVRNNRAYIRANKQSSIHFTSLGYEQYIHPKNNHFAKCNCFMIPNDILHCKDSLKSLYEQAVRELKAEKKKIPFSQRANIKRPLLRMLKQVGITDFETLVELGSIKSYLSIIEQPNYQDSPISILFDLEGAIRNIHSSVLTENLKAELTHNLENLGVVNSPCKIPTT